MKLTQKVLIWFSGIKICPFSRKVLYTLPFRKIFDRYDKIGSEEYNKKLRKWVMISKCVIFAAFQTSQESYQTSIHPQNFSFILKKTYTNRSECSEGKCKPTPLDLRQPFLEYLHWWWTKFLVQYSLHQLQRFI